MIKVLKLAANVMRKDGPILGFQNFVRLKYDKRDGLKAIKLAEYPSPIYYRNGASDVHLVRSILYLEEYNIDVRGLVIKNVVDLGANAGLASVFFANKFPSASVYSIEPEESNFRILSRNTKSYVNVKPQRMAIWGKDTNLYPKYESVDAWSFSLTEEVKDEGAVIRGVSIKSFLMEEALDSIDILKIDIEGGERSLFSGDCNWLQKVKIVVIELHDRKVKGCSEMFYRALLNAGVSFTQKNSGYNTVIYNESYFV